MQIAVAVDNSYIYVAWKGSLNLLLGKAKANSIPGNGLIVVTADKGLNAGMKRIQYPHEIIWDDTGRKSN